MSQVRARATVARQAAFRALVSIARGRCDSAAAVAAVRHDLSDPRDAALVSELVLGTLRQQGALDAALRPLVERGWDRLDLEVRVTLRMGAFQQLFLTRIPVSAAVNDAVSLVRGARRSSATGLVNAVLRRLEPSAVHASWPARPAATAMGDPAVREAELAYLSTTLSHPRWLVERWLERYGFEAAEAWARFNNTPAPLTIRRVAWRISTDRLVERLAAEGVTVRRAAYAPEALVVTEGQPLRSPLAAEGVFVAQDEASQLVAQLAGDLSPVAALDACAAPGGKATYLRGRMLEGRVLVACDLRPARVALLAATCAATGARNVHIVRADARALPFPPVFDLVLLDAPCSGLGTIRREPEIRWRREAVDLRAFATEQSLMLAEAATAVRRGGALLYATCSSEPEENEQVVDRFLAHVTTFARIEPDAHPWRASPLSEVLDSRGDLRTEPHRHGLEAFFAAVLRRA